MNADSVRFDMLCDADEHYRSGRCPWTFCAYPTTLDNDRGLPPDDEACELPAQLQQHGIDVAIWVNGISNDTTYFACRKENMHRLNDALQELETRGIIEKDFFLARTELFAQTGKVTEPSDAPKSPIGRDFE